MPEVLQAKFNNSFSLQPKKPVPDFMAVSKDYFSSSKDAFSLVVHATDLIDLLPFLGVKAK